MATHDYVIDNNTGANVRADINSVLKAILTNNSGTTDPATVISSDAGSKAFSFWADTNSSPAVLKIRNAADNAWIELFQLDGTLTLEDGSASTPALAFRDDLDTGIFSGGANEFNISTGGTERFVIDSSGRVLIGGATTSQGSTNSDDLQIGANNQGNQTGITLGSASASSIRFADAASDSAGSILYNHGTDDLTITAADNIILTGDAVGIGTTSPSANLESEGNVSSTTQFSGFQGLRIQNANGSAFGVTADINFVAGTGTNNRGAAIGVEFSGATNGNNLYFATNPNNIGSNDTLVEAMRITYDGKVCIGVTSTGHASTNADDLCVGNNDSSSQHGITIGSNNAASIRFADSASGGAGIINYEHGTTDAMTFYTGGGLRMTLDGSGNMLIGTASASVGTSSFGFVVFSNGAFNNFANVNGSSSVLRSGGNQGEAKVMGDGDLQNTNNTYTAISDQELKENIVDANSQWDDIKALKIRNYNFKESTGYNTHKQIGVVAQELETVSAGLVKTDDEGIKSVKYSVLYMKAIKCLQEAQTKIETLETKVAALEAA